MVAKKRKAKGRDPTKRSRPPLAAREQHAQSLHRRPVRWDALVHDLGVALAKVCWDERPNLAAPELRFPNDELRTIGSMLGRGAEIVIQQGLAEHPDWAAAVDAARFDLDVASAVARATREACFEPLLRKYTGTRRTCTCLAPRRA